MDIDFRLSNRDEDLKKFSEWVLHPDVLINTPVSNKKEVHWWADYILSFADYSACMTACHEGEPVGVASLLLLPYMKLRHHVPIAIAIDPKHWRKSIGSQLLSELENLARWRFKIEVISIETTQPSNLIGFCGKNGFTEFSRFENWFDVKGTMYPKLIFEKEL